MNVNPKYFLRAMAIAALLSVGITTTISSGGGGGSGDGGSPGTVTPPPSGLLAITGDNAQDVSSAFIGALIMSFDLSEITGGEITGMSAAGSTGVQKLLRNYNQATMTGSAEAPVAESCPYGGTVNVTYTLADPNTITIGDQIVAVFDSCDEGDGFVLDGQMNLTVADIQGDIMTDLFLLGLNVTMTSMMITEDTETVVVDADITLTVDTLDFPVIVETVEGSELGFTSGPEVLTFTNFEHVFQVDLGVIPEAVLVTANGRLDSVLLGGAVDYATTLAIQAIGDNDPYVGQFLISGDGSSVRIVINDSTSVTLEADTNGDGVIDQYIETTFAALSGDASSIDSSTALAIAQEVTHATTGFGLMAVAPGQQFFETEPFGQVQQMGLSGTFGPLEVACGHTGIVLVSGFVATAGTFSADDSLAANFSGCERYEGSDLVSGQLDFVVSSFTKGITGLDGRPPPFHVIGAAMATNLEWASSATAYIGSGSFETDYEFQENFGPVIVSTFSPSVSIGHGDVSNTLGDASASFRGSIQVEDWSYTGRLTSDRLNGGYSYQSLSPYSFLAIYPGNHLAYPAYGELLVTADDGSTLRIVVIDMENIRLDVDSDGDSIVDATILTLWTELLQ